MTGDRPGFLACCRADLASLADVKGTRWPSAAGLLDVLSLPGAWAAIVFRAASALHHAGVRPLSRMLYFLNVVLFSCDIAPGTRIGPGLALPHPVGVVVGGGASLGRRARLFRSVVIGGTMFQAIDGPMPVIGDECWLLDGARVFGPVTIGEACILGAGSTVTADVADGMWVLGPRATNEARPRPDVPNVGLTVK